MTQASWTEVAHADTALEAMTAVDAQMEAMARCALDAAIVTGQPVGGDEGISSTPRHSEAPQLPRLALPSFAVTGIHMRAGSSRGSLGGRFPPTERKAPRPRHTATAIGAGTALTAGGAPFWTSSKPVASGDVSRVVRSPILGAPRAPWHDGSVSTGSPRQLSAESCYRFSFMSADGTLAPPPVRGLRNLGNTCYMNSVLQVLAATHGVREHFLLRSDIADNGASANGQASERELTQTMRSLVWDLHCTGASADEALRPTSVLQAVARRHTMYARRSEQDSHELLRQILDGLRTEMSAALESTLASEKRQEAGGGKNGSDAKGRQTLVDELFSGELRSTIVCLTCGAVSCTSEPCLDISLPIPSRARRQAHQQAQQQAQQQDSVSAVELTATSTAFDGVSSSAVGVADVLAKLPTELTTAHEQLHLGACLQAFAAPEAMCADNAYVCEECAKAKPRRRHTTGHAAGQDESESQGEPALKWLQLSRVPSILTLHLMRFRSTGRRVHKLDEHVPFPTLLHIDPFTCAPGKPATHYSQLDDGGGGNGRDGGDGDGRDGGATPMRLYGVVEHQGSFSGGHYIAYVRLAQQWYRMSDSVVTAVTEEEVLHKQAFMLFYERMTA